MKFYVIYSFDCTKSSNPSYYDPPYKEDGWVQTEDDDDWEYNYLADENPHNEHIWRDGHHRKYVHDNLDKAQFLHFIKETGLRYEDVETMGSLTGIGWLPALSFNGESMTIYDEEGLISISAYVTPLPEPVRPMFSVRHNQEGFWPLTDDEKLTYIENRQTRYWAMIRNAFKEGAN